MKVSRWLRTGELSGNAITIKQVIDECASVLDDVNAAEIIGPAAFVGTDGKVYIVTVEAIISEAARDYAAELLADEKSMMTDVPYVDPNACGGCGTPAGYGCPPSCEVRDP